MKLLDAHRTAVLAGFSVLLLVNLALQARSRPFAHDEIYTIEIADLPSLRTIWAAELQGIDSAPPLNDLVTRIVHRAFRSGPIATRLPGIAGFWLAAALAFEIVRRRSNVALGLSAALLLHSMIGAEFGVQARGYGLMLGLFALSLFAWLEAARNNRRRVYLPLLTLALAAGFWNHYYAVLTLCPIAAGEVARFLRTKQIDWGVALAIFLSGVSVMPLLPHMKVVAAMAPTYWWHARLGDLVLTYRTVLGLFDVRRALALAALIAAALIVARKTFADPDGGRAGPAAHEVAAGLTSLLIPVLGTLLGSVAGAFVPRYALSAAVGFCIVVPLCIWWMGGRKRLAAAVLCAGLAAAFVQSTVQTILRSDRVEPFRNRPMLVAELNRPAPLVITGDLFLQAWYYVSPDARRRLWCLVDPKAAVQFIGTDSRDRDYATLGAWTDIGVQEYASFVATYDRFRLYSAPNDWLPQKLRADGARLHEVGRERGRSTYDVEIR